MGGDREDEEGDKQEEEKILLALWTRNKQVCVGLLMPFLISLTTVLYWIESEEAHLPVYTEGRLLPPSNTC